MPTLSQVCFENREITGLFQLNVGDSRTSILIWLSRKEVLCKCLQNGLSPRSETVQPGSQYFVTIAGQGGEKNLRALFFPNIPTVISSQVLYLAWWPLVRDSLFYLLSLVILMLVLMDNIVIWWDKFCFSSFEYTPSTSLNVKFAIGSPGRLILLVVNFS